MLPATRCLRFCSVLLRASLRTDPTPTAVWPSSAMRHGEKACPTPHVQHFQRGRASDLTQKIEPGAMCTSLCTLWLAPLVKSPPPARPITTHGVLMS